MIKIINKPEPKWTWETLTNEDPVSDGAVVMCIRPDNFLEQNGVYEVTGSIGSLLYLKEALPTGGYFKNRFLIRRPK